MSGTAAPYYAPYHSPSFKHLLKLALPLSGAMLSQALINLVDSALVGNLGGLALASVAIGSYMVFVLIAVPVGLATGIQILLSQQIHQQPSSIYRNYLHVSGWLMFIISLLLIIFGYNISPWLIEHFVLDDRMSGLTQAYFDWRLWTLPGIALSLLCRSYWISQQQPWLYTRILIITHLLNVPISYALIYGVGGLTAMGAEGAGIGTCISIYLGLTLQWLHWQLHGLYQQSISQKFIHLCRAPLRWIQLTCTLPIAYLGDIMRFAAPSGLTQLSFALYMAVLFWLISHLGATALATSFAVFNVGLIMILPFIGLGQAVSSLISRNTQNKHHLADNTQWIRLAIMIGLGIGVINLVCAWWLGNSLFKLVFNNHALISMAASSLPIYALALLTESANQVLNRSLIAYRHANYAALVNLGTMWLLIIPLSAYSLIYLNSYTSIWWIQLIGKVTLAICLWIGWVRCLGAAN